MQATLKYDGFVKMNYKLISTRRIIIAPERIGILKICLVAPAPVYQCRNGVE